MNNLHVKLTRKQVLQGLAGLALVSACGPGQQQDEDEQDTTNRCGGSQISGNHGHQVSLTATDLAGTSEKTFSIMGTSSHDHLITLTAAQLATLSGGGSVQVTSTEDAFHLHEVTVTCS